MFHLAFKALSRIGAGAANVGARTASQAAWAGKQMARGAHASKQFAAAKARKVYEGTDIARGSRVAGARADSIARRMGMSDMERETFVRRARRNAMGYQGAKLAGRGALSAGKFLTGGNVIGRSLAAVGDMVTLQKPRWENSAGIPHDEKREKGAGFFGRRKKGNGFSLASGSKGGIGSLFDSAKKILDVRLLASPGVDAITSAQGSTTKAVEESTDRISGAVSQTSAMLQGSDGKFKAGNPGGKSSEVKEAKLNGNQLKEISNNQKQQIVKSDTASKDEKEKLSIIAEHTDPAKLKSGDDAQKLLLSTGNKIAEEQVDYLAKSIGILNLIARLLGFQPKEQARRGKAILGGLALAGGAYAADEGFKKVSSLFNSGKETAESAFSAAGETVEDTKENLKEKGFEQTMQEDVIPAVQDFGKTVWEMFKDIVPAVKEFIYSIIKFFKTDSFGEHIKEFKNFFKTLWETVSELAKSLWHLFQSLYKALKPVIGFIFNTLATVGKVLVKSINFLANVISSIANAIANVVDWIRNSVIGRLFGIHDKRGASKNYAKEAAEKKLKEEGTSPEQKDSIGKKTLDIQEKQLIEMKLSRSDLKKENEKNRELLKKQAEKENEKKQEQLALSQEEVKTSKEIKKNTDKERDYDKVYDEFEVYLKKIEEQAREEYEKENPYIEQEETSKQIFNDVMLATNDFYTEAKDRAEGLETISDVADNALFLKNKAFEEVERMFDELLKSRLTTDEKGNQILHFEKEDLPLLSAISGKDIKSLKDLHKFETGIFNSGDYQEFNHWTGGKNKNYIGEGNVKLEDYLAHRNNLLKRDIKRDEGTIALSKKIAGNDETLGILDNENLKASGYGLNLFIDKDQIQRQKVFSEEYNKTIKRTNKTQKEIYEEGKEAYVADVLRQEKEDIAKEIKFTDSLFTATGNNEEFSTFYPPEDEKAVLLIQKERGMSLSMQKILDYNKNKQTVNPYLSPKANLTGSAEGIELGSKAMKQAEEIKAEREREKTVSALGGIMIQGGNNTTIVNQGGNASSSNHIPRGDEGIHLLASVPLQIAASRTGAGIV